MANDAAQEAYDGGHPGVAIRRRRTRDNDGRLTNASFIRLQRPVKEVLAALEAHTGYTTSGLAPGFKDYERDAEGLDEVMYHPRDRMCGARAGSLKAAVVGTTYLTPATCRVDDVEMEEVLEEDEEMIDVAATTAAAEGAYIHTGVTRSQRHVKKMYSSLAGLDGPSPGDGSSSKAPKKLLPKVPKFNETGCATPVPPTPAAGPKATTGTHHHQQQQRKVSSSSSAGTKRGREGVAPAAGVTRQGATGAAGHGSFADGYVPQQYMNSNAPLTAAAPAAAADNAGEERALKKIKTGHHSPVPRPDSRSVSPAPGTPVSSENNNLGGNSPAPSRSPSVGYSGGNNAGNGHQQQQLQQQQAHVRMPAVSPPPPVGGPRLTQVSRQQGQRHQQQQQQQQQQQGAMAPAARLQPGNGTGYQSNALQQGQQRQNQQAKQYFFPQQQY